MIFSGRRHRKILTSEFFADDGDPYGIRRFSPDEIDTFIDIGANVGLFSLQARFLFPTARIVAFEPDAIHYDMLTNNLDGLPIETHRLALGEPPEAFLIPARCTVSHVYEKQGKNSTATSCTAGWLSDIFRAAEIDNGHRAFLKIDAEGAENIILKHPESLAVLRSCTGIGIELHVRKQRFLTRCLTRFMRALKRTHAITTHAQYPRQIIIHATIKDR